MAHPLTDTDPRIERMRIELLRQMPPTEKLRIMVQLNQMARELIRSEISTRYPNASEADLRRLMLDRILGAELAEKVYGPLPDLINHHE